MRNKQYHKKKGEDAGWEIGTGEQAAMEELLFASCLCVDIIYNMQAMGVEGLGGRKGNSLEISKDFSKDLKNSVLWSLY